MRIALLALCAACGGGSPATAIDITWSDAAGTVTPDLLGENAVWSRGGLGVWDDTARAVKPEVGALVTALHPGMLRFPGGTRAMIYHFDETIGPVAQRKPQCDTFTGQLDATTWGMDEALAYAEQIGAPVSLVTPWYDGTPERAAAMVAYATALPDSQVAIGTDANGREWGTAGSWALRRAQNGHPAPYHVPLVEIGNEQYLTLQSGKTVCGTDHLYTQSERLEHGAYIPSTARDVAQQIAKTAHLIRLVDPAILVGAPALTDVLGNAVDPATAISDVDHQLATGDAWNPTLVALADFDVFVLHIYSFGSEPERVRLADELDATITSLRGLGGTHGFAVTEFGTLFDGDTQLNALISADFVRVATEQHAIANLRHILIEDNPTGLFATSAAILGVDHHTTPGYHAMQLLAGALQPIAVAASSAEPEVTVLATRDDATGALGIALIDRRLATNPIDLELPLPDGTWHGQLAIESAASLTDPDATIATTTVTAHGHVRITLPANGLAVISLAR